MIRIHMERDKTHRENYEICEILEKELMDRKFDEFFDAVVLSIGLLNRQREHIELRRYMRDNIFKKDISKFQDVANDFL